MADVTKTVIAFDLYGTLLSTESVAKDLTKHFSDEKANAIAATWRKYQLEYTWRLNSMKQYQPFDDITRSSLLHALEEHSATLSEPNITYLMRSYDALSTFPDVQPALKVFASKDSIIPVIFSNGTQSMVTNSVRSSPDLCPYEDVFADIVTIEDVQRFKPAPEVYHYLAKKVGKATDPKSMSSMWLVSGNPFDVVGARAVGMQAAWVDRAGHHSQGKGWTDRLVAKQNGPTVIVKSLEDVVAAVENYASNSR